MAENEAQPPPRTSAAPNPWAYGSDPLPADADTLVAQIKAAARQEDARFHRPFCPCDGCLLRRKRQEALIRKAS